MRVETVRDLALDHGLRLPESLREGYPPQLSAADERGWFRFQRLYDAARACVRGEADMRRIVREAAEDDAAFATRTDPDRARELLGLGAVLGRGPLEHLARPGTGVLGHPGAQAVERRRALLEGGGEGLHQQGAVALDPLAQCGDERALAGGAQGGLRGAAAVAAGRDPQAIKVFMGITVIVAATMPASSSTTPPSRTARRIQGPPCSSSA